MNCSFSIELIRNLFEKFLGVPDQSGIKGGNTALSKVENQQQTQPT